MSAADPSSGSGAGPPSPLRLIYAARALRGFGDGFAVILLPAYLSEIGFTPFEVGLVATAALLGSAVLTLGVGFLAARHDLRGLLIIGALFMVGTGLALPFSVHVAFVLAVVFLGTINPSTGDTGILVPLEHAMLARGVAHEERTRVFARYSLVGALATAAGALAAAAPEFLVEAGVPKVRSFTIMFFFYAALGLAGAVLYARVP